MIDVSRREDRGDTMRVKEKEETVRFHTPWSGTRVFRDDVLWETSKGQLLSTLMHPTLLNKGLSSLQLIHHLPPISGDMVTRESLRLDPPPNCA